jgi:dipeptidyl aminopeptidase/acylaminoacyl peptidase
MTFLLIRNRPESNMLAFRIPRECAGLALLLIAALAWAEVPLRTHDITVDDYFTQADLFDCVMSPDGKYIAYAEGRWQESSDDRKADLWVVEVAKAKVTRLTFDRAGERNLKWSPDNRWIYFAADRKRDGEKHPPYDGKTQVWRIAPTGGEAVPITQVEGGVSLYDVSCDGRSIVYTTEKEVIAPEWKSLWQPFKDVNYGHGIAKFSVVWRFDLPTWRAEKVIDDNRAVRDLALAPDGRRLAMITTPDDTVVSFEGQSRVDIFDFADKRVIPLPDRIYRAEAPSPYGWLERLAWSKDSRALAFTIIFDGYPGEILIAEWDGSQPDLFRLKRPEELSLRGYGSPLEWRGNSHALCFLGEEKARVRLCCATDVHGGRHGDIRTLTPGDVVTFSLSFSDSGHQWAAVMNDSRHLPDIYTSSGIDAPHPVTHVNPQADAWKFPKLEVVRWQGAHGDPVEGILELPPDYQKGQKLPLVVEIHGGPTTAAYDHIQFWIYGRTLLPAKGYALLTPNYRGSTGYGDKFLTDLIGHENDVDVQDILKGVDSLVERGIADPDRLGVCGWSNGGYLTNCLIAKTTRFKAASSGAGIVDTVMEWGANDEPAYAIVFKKGFPWSAPKNYQRASPTYELEKIKTPTLIHVGGNDERCPPGHSRMLYRALREYLHIPTELCIYPGEPHGLVKYKNRKAKMEWDLAWFDRYLRGQTSK